MRKLKLQIVMSIDGYIARTNGEMDWMIWDWDERLNAYIKEITEAVDCIVMGRKLAEGFIPHWTAAFNNPDGPEEGAQKMVETPKVVFSKTLRADSAKAMAWKNTVVENGDLVTEINALKKQEGKDIIVYGGANFVSDLIKHGLIDEYHLLINPTALGDGMPIFKTLNRQLDLNLIKAIPFECGITVLYYEPKRH